MCVRNQAAGNQFIAGTREFVRVANLENFPEALIGIKAHAVVVGNSNEQEVEELFQARQALIEPFAQESMINPAE
jgi:hypothetical protein